MCVAALRAALPGSGLAERDFQIFGRNDITPSVVWHIEFHTVYLVSNFFASHFNFLCINYDF
jgi:hypothetical protein